jgi:hypothetical protein
MVKNAENGGYGRKIADFVSATTKSSNFHKFTLIAAIVDRGIGLFLIDI